MCFYSSHADLKARIAEKDIIVYKQVIPYGIWIIHWLTKRFICKSYFTNYIYKKDKIQPYIMFPYLGYKPYVAVEEGYHSWDRRTLYSNAEFIIPKGALYYTSDLSNEIVSTSIIFKRWL